MGRCINWFDHDAPVGFNVHKLCTARPTAMQSPAPSNMAVIAVHFNFAGWQSLRDNYKRFAHEMRFWGVPFFVAELAIDGHAFEIPDAYLQFRGGPQNVLWQKEAMINRLVASLPPEYDSVAWLDADILFLNPNWYAHALSILAEYPVAQLYRSWQFTNRYGEIDIMGRGVGQCGGNFLVSRGHPEQQRGRQGGVCSRSVRRTPSGVMTC